mgnify:CR=1 FL=1
MDNLIKIAQDAMWTKKEVPSFKSGDTITVSYRIVEGNKERIQSFRGVVIQIKGRGITKMFTIRKVSNGVGVERIFPLYSPHIDSIEVNKVGVVRRSRIYYLRDLTGKKARRARACRPLRQTPRHRTRHRFPRCVPGRLPLLRSCRPTPACGFRWAPVDSTESRCERRPGCRPTPACGFRLASVDSTECRPTPACGFRRIYFYICITREPNPQML